MYNPIKAYFDYKLEKARIQSATVSKPFEMMKEVVTAQSDFLNKWMDGFKVTDLTTATSTTVRDIDEYHDEIEREHKDGLQQTNDFELDNSDLLSRIFPDF